jgi:hypothetical protein
MARRAFAISLMAIAAFVASYAHAAEMRGRHGLGRSGHAMLRANSAGDHRTGNDTYAKAASRERDKSSDAKIKSICRGC